MRGIPADTLRQTMTIEPYDHLFLAGVYGLMLVIRLIYGWQANRQGGKAVRRRDQVGHRS